MSQQSDRRRDASDLTDEELLARIARLDPNRFPLAEHADRVLREGDGERRGQPRPSGVGSRANRGQS